MDLVGGAFPLALASGVIKQARLEFMEKFKSKSWRSVPAVLALLVLNSSGRGTPLDSLVQNSPFAPPTGVPTTVDNTPLEFRGVLSDGGEFFFSIYNPAVRTSHWVGLAEPGLPFIIRSYDAAKQTIVADYQGRSLVLALKKAPLVAATVPIPTVSPVTIPPRELRPTTSPPDEAARLAAIATEVRRRRELRQKPAAMDPPAGTQP